MDRLILVATACTAGFIVGYAVSWALERFFGDPWYG